MSVLILHAHIIYLQETVLEKWTVCLRWVGKCLSSLSSKFKDAAAPIHRNIPLIHIKTAWDSAGSFTIVWGHVYEAKMALVNMYK